MNKKLVYFECEEEGHENNLLNQVCIDTSCRKRGLACLFCQYHNHKNHEMRPLRIFLNEVGGNLTKLQQSESLQSTSDKQSILEQYQSIKQCIVLFQSIIEEQLNKLVDDLDMEYKIRQKDSEDQNSESIVTQSLQKILDGECSSAQEQMQAIQVLVNQVNSAQMTMQLKSNKQVQDSKDKKEKVEQMEMSKNKIANCMSRITDELSVITKYVSNLISKDNSYVSKPANDQAMETESIRSVSKAMPTLQKGKRDQMEDMFLGKKNNMSYIKREESSNIEDLFNSQWAVESKRDQSIKALQAEMQQKSFDQNGEDTNDFEYAEKKKRKNSGTTNKKKKNTAKKTKQEQPNPIDENIEYSREAYYQEQEDNSKEESHCFYEIDTKKDQQKQQPSFTSSYTQQEVVLDVKLVVKFKAHGGITKDVVFLDDDRLATCSYDRQVRIWNYVDKKLLVTLKQHEGRIMQIKYSAKHKLIGTCAKDKTIMLWNDIEYTQKFKLLGHKESVMSIEFIDSRDILASGGSDKQIRMWCVLTGKQLFKVEDTPDSILQLQYDSNNDCLLAGGYKKVIVYALSVWIDPSKNDLLINNNKIDQGNKSNSNSNSNSIMENNKAKASLKMMVEFEAHQDAINMIQPILINNKQFLLTCSDDKTLKLWDFDNTLVVQTIQEDTMISAFCFFQKLGILVVSMWGYHGGGRTSYYDFQDFSKIQDVESISTGTTSLKTNEQQNKFVSSHENGEIQVYYMSY